MKKLMILGLSLLMWGGARAQQIDEDQLGIWYMYFVTKKFGDSRFGLQGDYQFRFWNVGTSDLEQMLLRTGFTYRPRNAEALLTLGYASITTGEFGESSDTFHENRIYQEALLPHRVSKRLRLNHRFRYEQRWVAGQDFRTRYRYNLFVNVLLTQKELNQGGLYLALYNEIFINGQTDIGRGRTVALFDRNRTYGALGYGLSDELRAQVGCMLQTTANWQKAQLQLSLHHNF